MSMKETMNGINQKELKENFDFLKGNIFSIENYKKSSKHQCEWMDVKIKTKKEKKSPIFVTSNYEISGYPSISKNNKFISVPFKKIKDDNLLDMINEGFLNLVNRMEDEKETKKYTCENKGIYRLKISINEKGDLHYYGDQLVSYIDNKVLKDLPLTKNNYSEYLKPNTPCCFKFKVNNIIKSNFGYSLDLHILKMYVKKSRPIEISEILEKFIEE